jgi:hypothetical protein
VTPLTAMLRMIYPLVRTAAEPVALNALREAADDFCRRSAFWVEALDPISTVAGEAEYELDSPDSDSVVLHVRSVTYKGRALSPRSHDELDQLYAGRDWMSVAGAPAFYTQFSADTVRLVPVPETSEDDVLQVRVALGVSDTATRIPSDLHTFFARDIVFGAAAMLMKEQGREYYDPVVARDYEFRFYQAVNTARIMASKGRTRAQLQVSMVRL